ncbi:hypothetical protein GCM10007424_20240 [Flavobacterium suaedae]|uniref:Lipocalin-like domain-containing protein n=1 Tax=Flavobacterium suaedae TaxID=1767027 RepID=A0ABQ1JZD6_9FLAO|nr:lipocalin family protein [Flavobacterium suaedae]GGB80051.1 hypothetical protein GCM10007424_20240 [Flavobacterium suaedae]
MKKIFLLLFAFAALSCSSDDDNGVVDNGLKDPYTGSVVGSWETVSIWRDDYIILLDCEDENLEETSYLLTFNENGSFDMYNKCTEAFLGTGTYTTTGNVLTITINGETGKAHMIDHLDEDQQLAFRFTIGDGGLFYGYEYRVQAVPTE